MIDMRDFDSWWEIAQLIGAGATCVLIPAVKKLWDQHTEDTRYIREADKNMLTVLASLTEGLREGSNRQEETLEGIWKAIESIREHIQEDRP